MSQARRKGYVTGPSTNHTGFSRNLVRFACVYKVAVIRDVSGFTRQKHLNLFLGADVWRPDKFANSFKLSLPSENSFTYPNGCACYARFHKAKYGPS